MSVTKSSSKNVPVNVTRDVRVDPIAVMTSENNAVSKKLDSGEGSFVYLTSHYNLG